MAERAVLRLLWGIMWRMVLYGLAFGTLFGSLVGALFGLLAMLFTLPWTEAGILILYGALLGGGIGALLGLADGLAMSAVTYAAPTRFSAWNAYRSAMHSSAMSANIACGIVVFILTSINMSITGKLLELIGILCLYALLTSIVCGAAWLAVDRVMKWVERYKLNVETLAHI
jgi:hypothetical protein